MSPLVTLELFHWRISSPVTFIPQVSQAYSLSSCVLCLCFLRLAFDLHTTEQTSHTRDSLLLFSSLFPTFFLTFSENLHIVVAIDKVDKHWPVSQTINIKKEVKEEPIVPRKSNLFTISFSLIIPDPAVLELLSVKILNIWCPNLLTK